MRVVLGGTRRYVRKLLDVVHEGDYRTLPHGMAPAGVTRDCNIARVSLERWRGCGGTG